MTTRTTAISLRTVVRFALHELFRQPSYLVPAFLLLAPQLLLQLVAPAYLRTRLAPAAWTVAAGAVLLIWLGQAGVPAICALVHARRIGGRLTNRLSFVRLGTAFATRVTAGLLAGVLPGLWLQARYAFAPLLLRGDEQPSTCFGASAGETRGVHGRLMLLAGAALVASAVGQSAVAALAEAMNTITVVEPVNGRAVFELHFFPHAVTTIAAYVWSAATLTFYALSVSTVFDETRGTAAIRLAVARERGASVRVQAGRVAVAAVTGAALVATAYKLQQHLP